MYDNISEGFKLVKNFFACCTMELTMKNIKDMSPSQATRHILIMKIIKYYATVKKDEAEGCKKNRLSVLHWFKIYEWTYSKHRQVCSKTNKT